MNKKIILLISCTFLISSYARAQETMIFPTTIQHNGRTVVLYPDVTLLVVDPGYSGNDNVLNALIEENKMNSLFSNDSLKNAITSNGRNLWLERLNKSSLLPQDYKSIQSKLPAGVYLGPAYRSPGRNSLEGVFVPLPNVLVMDKDFVNDEIIGFLQKQKYVEVDIERSARQVSLTILNVKGKANAYYVRDRIVRRFPAMAEHIRFENQPYLSEQRRESQSAATSAYDPWNIHIIQAQPEKYDSRSPVKVGILDFGCDLTHQGLNLERGTNLKYPSKDGGIVGGRSHGTKMAGIIGARPSTGLESIVPNIILVPIARESQTDVELSEGISYCINNKIDVINMSFGRDGSGKLVGAPAWDFKNINGAIERAFNADIIMVAAAGNNFNSGSVDYPARHPNVIAVGASDRYDKRIASSNFGDTTFLDQTTGVSVVGPGDNMTSTTARNDATTNFFGGTSAATAHVAGFAAFLKSTKSTLTNAEIRNLIESTADKIDTNNLTYSNISNFNNGTRNPEVGYGRINILNAINKLESQARITPLINPNNTGNSGGDPPPPPPPAPPSRWWLWLIGLLILAIILYFIFKKK